MAAIAPANNLDRRKQVRLRVRPDLQITPQRYEGRTFYVVKDPVSLRYYRFKEQEHFLLSLMDGKHTLDESQKAFEARFRPDRLTLEDLEHFGQQLLTAGLVQNETPQAGTLLFERRKKRRRTEMLQTLTNILYIKIPVIDPDRILKKMLVYLHWMFTWWFLTLSVMFLGAAMSLVLTHFDTFVSRLPSYQEFFSFKTAIYLWFALGVVKIIHEFGHGLSCKAFGGEVHEMGFLILCFSPAMYCNVSDAWTLPNKWRRIIIGGAGIYVELMIAALATFIWWYTPSQPFINNLSLSLMIVCSVSTVVFNDNPLMRYDGYYVLADWLEIPNLRERANRYIQSIAMEKGLGIEVQPEPYMELSRRILFVTYAVISWVYKWVVTFFILHFIANFLKPYKLEVISQLLAVFSLGSMFGWPLFRLFKNIAKRGRLPDMKASRAWVSASLLAGVALAFLFMPLPVSRVRSPAVVQFQPEYVTNVFPPVEGVLKKIHVREGEYVAEDRIIAEFSNLDIETRLDQANNAIKNKSDLIDLYTRQLNAAIDPKDKQQISAAKVKADGDRRIARQKKIMAENELAQLVIRAPRSGVIVGLPHLDEVGKKWDREQGVAFCSIGDRTKLRVLAPIFTGDYELIRENLHRQKGQTLAATIRMQGRAGQTWEGKVFDKKLPRGEAKEVPLPLSNRGGGPIALKPGASDGNHLVPMNQIYLVPIDFEAPDEAVCTGTMAQVKVHCRWRSLGWWTWRTVASAFDIKLL